MKAYLAVIQIKDDEDLASVLARINETGIVRMDLYAEPGMPVRETEKQRVDKIIETAFHRTVKEFRQ